LLKRATPRGKPIPPLIPAATPGERVQVAIEHAFTARKCWLGLLIR
jgi:hypothetical protein